MNESYISKMSRYENMCYELLERAREEYESHGFRHTKEECTYYQRAASLHYQMAGMSVGEERLYHQRKVREINDKIREIIMEVDPDFIKKLKEKKQKETVENNVKPNGTAGSKDKDKVDEEEVKGWFKDAPKHSFEDVSGMMDLKEQLRECIISFQHRKIEDYLKLKKVHSFFFIGPPGCGKTYIIEAFAHELIQENYKFLSLRGSDILSRYVGTAEKVVDRFFEEAQKNAPCIVFVDEIDGVCKNRSSANLPEYASTLTTAFLTGYNSINSSDKDIIFIGATNYPNQVDDAMLDRVELIRVPFPDDGARESAYARKFDGMIKLEEGFTYEEMSDKSVKFNYRDIDRLTDRLKKQIKKEVMEVYKEDQEAAIEAMQKGNFLLTRQLFDQVLSGFIPTPKDEIEKELDEWENRFNKGLNE